MATPTHADAKDLIALAERMGIPAVEAIRQVAQLIDLGPTVKNANVLRTFRAVDVVAMTGG